MDLSYFQVSQFLFIMASFNTSYFPQQRWLLIFLVYLELRSGESALLRDPNLLAFSSPFGKPLPVPAIASLAAEIERVLIACDNFCQAELNEKHFWKREGI